MSEAPFRLAHLSDPHLTPIVSPRLREIVNKRGLGFINYRRHRRQRHQMPVLEALLADLRSQRVDHIALTGDLVNFSLESEYASASRFLEGLASPHDLSLVPGNHDAYLPAVAGRPLRDWGAYMCGDAALPSFPYIRRRGPVGIVGVNSGVPTWLFSASGRVGPEQTRSVGEALHQLEQEGLFRVVLVHHPVAPGSASRLRDLVDADSFRAMLSRFGAELVLHGHNHRPSHALIGGREHPIPVIGVPSASMDPLGPGAPAAYNVYGISGQPGRWTCAAIIRERAEAGFRQTRRFDVFGAQGQVR